MSHPALARDTDEVGDPAVTGDAHPAARYCIVGGAGFIGSHFVDRLLSEPSTDSVTVFDNFSSGASGTWPITPTTAVSGSSPVTPRISSTSSPPWRGSEAVIHLASNPDIARASKEPAIDFDAGTLLTHHVVEAMRLSGAQRILYASGSGVYGDLGELEADEDHGPLLPVSTYGASKLAGEALISRPTAACSDSRACIFRFGNVVGARQTHGVGFDFVRRLLGDPTPSPHPRRRPAEQVLRPRGDVIDAVMLGAQAPPPARWPSTTSPPATTSPSTEIAELAVRVLA